ncbi:MAG TPA: flagellar biosynthesis anti-sigma factor FlgM, partial [Desulfobaccales bacterium]|nr:flagellar biosynthesis anti-sigma factor FlgM [Desulfobaccales bacterium]
ALKITMNKPRKPRPGRKFPPVKCKGGTRGHGRVPRAPGGSDVLAGNSSLLLQVRRIIAATPEVRLEKVAPLKKAVAEGAYEIDARELANILIAKLILDFRDPALFE